MKKRYNRWVEKLRREWEGGATAYAVSLHLNIYKLLWVIVMSFLWGKLLYSFVDSCSAAAWERNKHNREVTLKLNCISWRKLKILCILCFYEIAQWRLMGEIYHLLAKVTKNNTPTAMLLIYEEQSTSGKIHTRGTYCGRNCGNSAEAQRWSEQDCRKPWGKAGTQRSLLANSFAPQHPREHPMH